MTVADLQALYAEVFLESGRSPVFGEVTLRLPDGQAAARATGTSALL